MPNPYDQFDETESSNPYDQFEPVRKTPLQMMPQRTGWEQFVRQLGLTARPIIKAAAAPGVMLGSALGMDTGPALERTMGRIGLPAPETPAERLVGSATEGLASAAMPIGAAGLAKPVSAVGKGIAEQFMAKPVAQLASGATSGAAAQGAAEMGADPSVQAAASLAGGAVPFGFPSRGVSAPTLKGEMFKEARKKGYVVTPTAVESSGASNMLESITNKMKITAKTSSKNAQARANDIRLELGLGKGNDISLPEIEQVQQNAYKDYENLAKAEYAKVKETIPPKYLSDWNTIGTKIERVGGVRPTPEFEKKINDLIQETTQLREKYPSLVEAPTMAALKRKSAQLLKEHTPEDAVELLKSLRRQATANLSSPVGARPTAMKEALGQFQYKAATALEDLIEQNLKKSGNKELMDAFRQSRKTLAKTYDVLYALNPATGEISGQRLVNRLNKSPMTGALKRAAEFAKSFPADNREVSRVGGHPSFSAWDFLVAGGTAAAKHPAVAVGELAARYGSPGLLTSEMYQNRLRPNLKEFESAKPGAYPPALLNQLLRMGQTETPQP